MCHIRFAIALSLILALLATVPISSSVARAATCAVFSSQAATQAAYRADPTGLRNLGRDGGGIACESHPAPYDFTPVGQPAPGPATSFGDGTFRVGIDIAPGTYRNSDSSQGCYWERLSGFGGTLDEIIANNFTRARQVVTISPSDAGFSSEGCGQWSQELSPITPSPTDPFSDGIYIVGADIAPGLWRNSDSSGFCYWARLSGFGGTLDEIIANRLSESIQTVRIAATDRGFETNGCGVWTRIGD